MVSHPETNSTGVRFRQRYNLKVTIRGLLPRKTNTKIPFPCGPTIPKMLRSMTGALSEVRIGGVVGQLAAGSAYSIPSQKPTGINICGGQVLPWFQPEGHFSLSSLLRLAADSALGEPHTSPRFTLWNEFQIVLADGSLVTANNDSKLNCGFSPIWRGARNCATVNATFSISPIFNHKSIVARTLLPR